MKDISIIIITFNRPDDTLDLLKDIAQLNYKELLSNVIITNNASTANYTAVKWFIEQHNYIPFKYIDAPVNYGVAGGRNYATQFAEGNILVYIDDDTTIEDTDWLKKIVEAFSIKECDGRKLGALSFKVLYTANREIQKTAFPHKQFEKYKGKHSFLTYYYVGCAHAILREAWNKAGTYPDDFFYGMEEYDLSYRILDKGYCIRYDDSIIILHKESPLGRQTKAEKLRFMWVNKSRVTWRYLPKKYFFSAAIMWSIEYLRKSKFDIGNFITGLKKIGRIPSEEKRTPLKKETFEYLRKVNARLWY